MNNQIRDQFEAAVIERMKEGGFLEIEIRVECLSKDQSGNYHDGSVDTYWHYWQASRAALVIELPPAIDELDACDALGEDYATDCAHMSNGAIGACAAFIHAAGVKTK